VLAQLLLGPLANDVVAELEQEQAAAVARGTEREGLRRRLGREISALEGNLAMLLESEVLKPERYAAIEAKIDAKRTELRALDTEPEPAIARHLDVEQAATVRQLLDGLEERWPTL